MRPDAQQALRLAFDALPWNMQHTPLTILQTIVLLGISNRVVCSMYGDCRLTCKWLSESQYASMRKADECPDQETNYVPSFIFKRRWMLDSFTVVSAVW